MVASSRPNDAPLDYYAWVGAFTGGMLLLVIAPDFVSSAAQGKFDLGLLQQGIQQRTEQVKGAISGGSGEDSFNAFYEFSRKWEGGYSNNPADAGGSTQNGVTQGTYDNYRAGKGLAKQDVKQISGDEVKAVYRARWDAGKCGSYAAPLSIVCGDTWVNFNPDANNAGWFFKDLNTSDPKAGALEVVKRRMAYRQEKAGKQSSQQRFLSGWLNRDRDLEKVVQGHQASAAVAVAPRSPASPVTTASSPVQSVVSVYAGHEMGTAVSFGNRRLVTCAHVLKEAEGDRVTVKLPNGGQASATIKKQNRDLDLALLELDQDIPAIALATELPKLGDAVTSIGNRFGKPGTKTEGKVIRAEPNTAIKTESNLLQPGNSGGAIVNERGQLIGIGWQTSNRNSLSIPLSVVQEFMR